MKLHQLSTASTPCLQTPQQCTTWCTLNNRRAGPVTTTFGCVCARACVPVHVQVWQVTSLIFLQTTWHHGCWVLQTDAENLHVFPVPITKQIAVNEHVPTGEKLGTPGALWPRGGAQGEQCNHGRSGPIWAITEYCEEGYARKMGHVDALCGYCVVTVCALHACMQCPRNETQPRRKGGNHTAFMQVSQGS